MLPVIALVGRPNVGKSTLFNALTGTRDAIVADVPGVTRDRQYGYGRIGPVPYVAIDTGGLVENPTGIEAQMREQTERAVEEAPRDVSARAATRTLAMRISDLNAFRDALAAVQQASVDTRVQRLYSSDSPLADYVRGLYSWAHSVVRALDTLAASLKTLSPDWAMLRWRIDEAKNFHFDELQEPIRKDLVALVIVANAGSLGPRPPNVEELQYAIERLFSTANALEEHLDERFG